MLNLPYCHADPFPEEPTGIKGTDTSGKAYGGRFTRQPGDKDYEDYKDKPMRHDKTLERNQRELRVGTLADVSGQTCARAASPGQGALERFTCKKLAVPLNSMPGLSAFITPASS